MEGSQGGYLVSLYLKAYIPFSKGDTPLESPAKRGSTPLDSTRQEYVQQILSSGQGDVSCLTQA